MRIPSIVLAALLTATVAIAQTSRGGYTRLEIMPLAVPFGTMVPGEFREALTQNLVAELQKTRVFSDVLVSTGAAADPNTLRLAMTVARFNPGDPDVRAGVGLGFGATRMDVRVRLLDARSCAVVAEGQADGKVIGGWMGGNSLGATRGVAKDVAKIAARVNRGVPTDAATVCDPEDGVTPVGTTIAPPSAEITALTSEAERGDPVAQLNLAIRYAKGDGVPKNEARPMKWCKLAAEAGDAAAQTELSMRYTMGWALPIDDVAALSWLRKAAAQEYPAALAVLGVRHEQGQGVTRSSVDAVRYYRAAAERGHARAMCYLGDMYLRGDGVGIDAADAYRWHVAAVAAGDTRCEAHLKISSKKMSRNSRAAADRDGREWAKKYTG